MSVIRLLLPFSVYGAIYKAYVSPQAKGKQLTVKGITLTIRIVSPKNRQANYLFIFLYLRNSELSMWKISRRM